MVAPPPMSINGCRRVDVVDGTYSDEDRDAAGPRATCPGVVAVRGGGPDLLNLSTTKSSPSRMRESEVRRGRSRRGLGVARATRFAAQDWWDLAALFFAAVEDERWANIARPSCSAPRAGLFLARSGRGGQSAAPRTPWCSGARPQLRSARAACQSAAARATGHRTSGRSPSGAPARPPRADASRCSCCSMSARTSRLKAACSWVSFQSIAYVVSGIRPLRCGFFEGRPRRASR